MSQITTHVLDTSRGIPAANVVVRLWQQTDNSWSEIAYGTTNADGRVANWMNDDVLAAGVFKLEFLTRDYFDATATNSFYPKVEIIFEIGGDGQHYHVPLLLNPFGYSTYRGS